MSIKIGTDRTLKQVCETMCAAATDPNLQRPSYEAKDMTKRPASDSLNPGA